MKDTITLYITDRSGTTHTIEAPTDMNLNLMEVCKMSDLGVLGTCGGMALCASCQVYVDSDHELPSQSDAELDMLDQAFHVQPNSRLGCQLHINENLDGLKVTIAPE